MSQDLIGQQFGNYRLVRRLGGGGFADVYLGQHMRLASQQAAVKLLHLTSVHEQAFLQEAERTASLRHPHIVQLYDFDIQQGTPFLVLEYAPNGSLARHKGQRLPFETIVHYLKQIAPTLQYAHDHMVIHRDIKPDNILVNARGELLVSDFGIAVLAKTGTTSLQSAQTVSGTPTYMAPEMFRGRPQKASDQYALGITVYAWLCGKPPFTEGDFIELGYQHTHEPVPSLCEQHPLISPKIEEVVMRALSKDPAQRFSSIEAFAGALEEAGPKGVPLGVNAPLLPELTVQQPSALVALAEEPVNQQKKAVFPQTDRDADTPPPQGRPVTTPVASALPLQRVIAPPGHPRRLLLSKRALLLGSVLLVLLLSGIGILSWGTRSVGQATGTPTRVVTSTPSSASTNTLAVGATSSPTITPTFSPPSALQTPSISGYSVSGGGLTGLKAQWYIPQFTYTGALGEQAVIGIQLGCWSGNLPSDCLRLFVYIVVGANNATNIVATYAYYTPSQVTANLSLTVSPGDVILASMEYTAGHAKPWAFTMTNQTRGGQTAQVLLSDTTSRSNAIFYVGNVYDPTTSRYFPLPKFGPITFQTVEVRYSAGWVGINTLQYGPLDLVQNTTTLLQVSPLNGDSFTVTRSNS